MFSRLPVSASLILASPRLLSSLPRVAHFSLPAGSRVGPPQLRPEPIRYETPNRGPISRLVDQFNDSLLNHPIELVASLVTLEGVGWFFCSSCISLSGAQFSSSILLAYAGTWAIRKLPGAKLITAGALSGPLAFIFPPLKFVRLTRIFDSTAWHRLKLGTAEFFFPIRRALRPLVNEFYFLRRLVAEPSDDSKLRSADRRRRLTEMINKFGLIYFISYRISGALIVLSAYYYLEFFSSPDSSFFQFLQSSSEALARTFSPNFVGAFVLSGFIFPIGVMFSPLVAKKVFVPISAKVGQLFRNKLRSH